MLFYALFPLTFLFFPFPPVFLHFLSYFFSYYHSALPEGKVPNVKTNIFLS